MYKHYAIYDCKIVFGGDILYLNFNDCAVYGGTMEENINGELTLKKIWQQIKKSGIRIIVYAIVALIVSGGILGICDIFVSESQYETNITFYYSGAENGEDPNGGLVDVAAGITSAGNVSAALDKLQYDDEKKDKLVGLIINNLAVTTIVENEVKNEENVVLSGNYSYRVVLSQNAKIDKFIDSRNAYNNIVSAITSNYIETFKAKYSLGVGNLGNLSVSDSYNAFQKYTVVRGNINTFLQECKFSSDTAPTFLSTSQNTTSGNLQSRIETILLPKLEAYGDFVASNGIDANNEKDYVDKMLAEANKDLEVKEKDVELCLNALSLLTSGSITPSDGQWIVNPANPENLNKAIEDLNKARSARDSAVSNQVFWERCQKDYENAQSFADKTDEEKTALVNSANALVEDVIKEYNSLINSFQLMVEDYNAGYSVNSLVRMTSAAEQSTTSPITLKVGLIVELMVLIVAVIIAMLVTSKKGAMVIKKKQQAEQEQQLVIESNEQTESAEEVSTQTDKQDDNNL